MRKDLGDRKTEKVQSFHGLNDLFFYPFEHPMSQITHIPIC